MDYEALIADLEAQLEAQQAQYDSLEDDLHNLGYQSGIEISNLEAELADIEENDQYDLELFDALLEFYKTYTRNEDLANVKRDVSNLLLGRDIIV